MQEPARDPDDLERLFVERANAGDVEGLVALYEPDAILVSGSGEVLVGADQIRRFFVIYLSRHPRLEPSDQTPALRRDDLALTSSRHSNGDVSAEIARRQPDGSWLWAVDRFSL